MQRDTVRVTHEQRTHTYGVRCLARAGRMLMIGWALNDFYGPVQQFVQLDQLALGFECSSARAPQWWCYVHAATQPKLVRPPRIGW